MRTILYIVPMACIISRMTAVGAYQELTQLKLSDLMPENARNYDKMRPPRRDDQPTKVDFHVTVMGIDSINENSMTYAADIFFAQTWEDYRLRLPENMTSEYRLLEVEWLKEMWRPDSYFKNAKQVTFQTMTIPNHYVWLYNSKVILYMVKLTLTLSCAMNYIVYPHDTQECKLQIESLSHTTEDLVFEWEDEVPLVVSDDIELPQFDLVSKTIGDCTQVYSTGNFTCLEVVFTLKRRLGYYLFHTYIPTCLIVIMSWISFWIKPEAAPARVTLGVTSLLTLSTQHAKSQASLPPVSYIKIIDMFMNTCTVFVFLALMEYALVNKMLGDGPDALPPPAPNPSKKSIFGKKASSKPLCEQLGSLGEADAQRHLDPKERENGRLVFLARQLRFTGPSNFPSQSNNSDSAHSSPKHGHYSSVDKPASQSDIQMVTFSHHSLGRRSSPKPTTSRVLYKCGHEVPETAPAVRGREGNCCAHRRMEAPGASSSSSSYPFLSECDAMYFENRRNRQHAHSHCRSYSVGPYFRHTRCTKDSNNEININDENCKRERNEDRYENLLATSKDIEHISPSRDHRRGEVPEISAADLESDLRRIVSSPRLRGHDMPGPVPPPPPPPPTHPPQQSTPTISEAAKNQKWRVKRAKAIMIDRFSRVFFPLSFFLINFIYWATVWSYL